MKFKLKDFFKKFGPGIITGASDDDPSGIGTYSSAGSQFGLKTLWLAIFTFPLMAVVQETCARIGMVTGRGLAGVIKRYYSKYILYLCVGLLVVTNTLNIGTDIGAMASSLGLLIDIPFAALAIGLVIIILALEIFVSYKNYAKILKWTAVALFSYFVTALIVVSDWREVFDYTFLPAIVWNREFLIIVLAILGTTISPYLFFWQSSEEVEEEVMSGKKTVKSRMGATYQQIKDMRLDVWVGMLFSNLAMWFIIVTTGSTLFKNGLFDIQTAEQAASALRPLAGNFASLLFTIGIVGVGLLGVPVLAGSASYALSEALGWKEGLYRKWSQARGFYLVIVFSTLIGLLMNFVGINPMKALIYTAVVNGLVAPVMLWMILLIANDKKIMGDWTNGKWSNIFGGLAFAIMAIAAVLFFVV
jgi:NRAMP (natural resistance-associated macrophage protein)-like metal ion transporter